MSSPTLHQRDGRPSKSKSTRKRSASSPFASLFATLTSFSSSGHFESDRSSSTPKPPESPPAATDASRKSRRHLRRRTESRSDMPTPRTADPKTPARRQSTPQKQLVKQAQPVVTTTTPNSGARPNVFSFMSGEISTPPTPRPHAGPARGLGITANKTVERSAGLNQVSSPIPRRPLQIPQSPISLSSGSDSDEAPSTIPSPPQTPTPSDAKALAASKAARRSFERITGQDAVGRSIRTEDYYSRHPRNQIVTPPEVPMPPHLVLQQQQQQQQQHQQQQLHQQSQNQQLQYSPGRDYQQSSPTFPPQSPPGMYGQPASYSVPYPTPPLEQPLTAGHHPRLPQTIGEFPDGEMELQKDSSGQREAVPEYLPRQYRILTLSTIKRTEMMIDGLETELRSLDKSVPFWQREQLTMRLTNTLVMHHRLVDTWSKVSQLSPLTMSRKEDRRKIEAVWSQLRQQYSHRSQINGLGVDKFISNIVNDLVHVGENAQSNGREERESFLARTQDMRMIIVLLGLILTLLLLRDETFQKITIGAGIVLGIYTITGAHSQNSTSKENGIRTGNGYSGASKDALARPAA